MQKILLIAPLPPPYTGQAVATEILISSTLKERFSLRVLDIGWQSLQKSGEFTIGRAREVLSYVWKFARELAFRKPDIVYITIAQSALGFVRDAPFIWLSSVFGVKCIAHLHGGNLRTVYDCLPSFRKWLYRRTLQRLAIVIVLAESLRPIFEGLISPDKIRTIPNCVEDEMLPSEREAGEKLKRIADENADREFKVLYLSNLIRSKGYFDVLSAAVHLAEHKRQCRFMFAGAFDDPASREEVESFINQHGIANMVEFLGTVTGEAKKELLLACDLFVLPSYYPEEGLPISMLEAMGAGLPVIVTHYRGMRDVVVDSENGFFVPPASPESIASKIEVIMNDVTLHLAMARNNIELIRERFNESTYVDAFSQLLTEIAGD